MLQSFNGLTEVARNVAADTLTDLRKMNSIWDRACAFNNLLDVLQKAVKNAADFDKLFPEANVKISRGKMLLTVKPLRDLGLSAVAYVKYTGYKRGWNAGSFTKLVRKVLDDHTNPYSESNNLYPEVDYKVYVRDTNSKPVARLNLLAEDEGYPSILLIEGFKDDVDAADIKKVAKALNISSLPAPKTVSNSKGGEARPRAFKMNTNGHVNISSSREWEPLYDNLDDIGEAIWVRMDRHDISWHDDNRLVLEAAKRGLVDLPVIAVNNQTAKRIEDGKVGEQLTSIKDAATGIRAQAESVLPNLRALAKYREFSREVVSGNRQVQQVIKNTVKGLTAVTARIDQLEKRVDGWEWASNHLNDDKDAYTKACVEGQTAGQARNKVVKDRYPLLVHLGNYAEVDEAHIKEYIELMDAK